MKEFLEHKDVVEAIKIADQVKQNKVRFSDIEDSEGNQYVDLVQEGGGVLGIALVGYTYVLERAGVRFFSVAGTSAGAINTMMVASMGNVGDAVSEKILEVLSAKNLGDLVDGEKAVKKVINKAMSGDGGMFWPLAFNGLKIWKILKRQLGVNPGNDFVSWITNVLKENGVTTVKDLLEKRALLPELKDINGGDVSAMKAKMALVSSDVTTNTKTEFPRMASLYFKDPETVNPALMVRASMSVPFFFEPFVARNMPNAGNENDQNWIDLASYRGKVPNHAKFVDGGMLSNFPINIFHKKEGVPRMPTFGVRLSTYRKEYNKTDSLFQMAGAMVSTMRQIHDYDFLVKNPDYNRLICLIDADKEFNWLNFNMTKDKQVELFALGARKASEFIQSFDWTGYKDVRLKLEQASKS
jgi:NTE family protein